VKTQRLAVSASVLRLLDASQPSLSGNINCLSVLIGGEILFRGDQGEIKGKVETSYYKMKKKKRKKKEKDNYLIQTKKCKRLIGSRSGLWKANKRPKYKDGRQWNSDVTAEFLPEFPEDRNVLSAL
jgi:hypothetical protein